MTARFRGIALLLLVFIILTGITLTSCDLFPPPPATDAQATPLPTGPTKALVTFFVTIPPNSPPEEPVIMSVLDEVTGLGLNPRRYTMELVEDGRYVLGLPLPLGTVLKYRYSRQGEILAEEHTTDGRPVRYRLYQVAGPGEVHDVVARWNDTRYEGSTGRIEGTVTDAATQRPIPGMMVNAGGAQVITRGDGGFLIEGLPPGTHNLVVYAPNGSYRTFQHGAVIAPESTTPAPIQLHAAPKVDITFVVHVPDDTPAAVPLRLAGNLIQLGNTFANLSGGVSTLAARMPVLSPLPDGTYGIILGLPAGAFVTYKYTLGDGFWNSERDANGQFALRQFIVPEEPTLIEDYIETWHAGEAAPITFDITIPENTPEEDPIFIQFNPYGWMEPIPMWHLEGQRWAYILNSPLDMVQKLGYRYCRAGQCGHADDIRSPGVHAIGQVVETAHDPQGLPDKIPGWAWLDSNPLEGSFPEVHVKKPRGPGFLAGVEFQDRFHPSWIPQIPTALTNIASLGANWVILTPGWTFTRLDPPVLEPVAGQDPSWFETTEIIQQAKNQRLNIALRPVLHYPTRVDEWWRNALKDFPWWVSWFDRFRSYALHHADLAEQQGIPLLILGGEEMAPALPGGKLADGSPSGVPPDADLRYRELIAEIRQRYNGTLGWALRYPEDILNPPGFINDVDMLYVLWSVPLSENPDASIKKLEKKANRVLSVDIYALWLVWQMDKENKDLVISIAYPSIKGTTTRCLADPIVECLPPDALNYPAPDYPLLELDLEAQARAYHAVLSAINKSDWVSGVVSRGYYPPTVLIDKSTSIHGKPAAEVLQRWFTALQQE